MGITSSSVHWVTSIEVVTKQVNSHRWQAFRFKMEDGSTHEMIAHLAEGYPGFEYMQREETPKRRVEDLPRPPGLPEVG